MVLKSEKTGGSIEMPDDSTSPSRLPGKIEIRGGGALAKPKETGIQIPPGAIASGASTFVVVICIFGILNGAGVILPTYSWACIGILIGVINPIGRSKRS